MKLGVIPSGNKGSFKNNLKKYVKAEIICNSKSAVTRDFTRWRHHDKNLVPVPWLAVQAAFGTQLTAHSMCGDVTISYSLQVEDKGGKTASVKTTVSLRDCFGKKPVSLDFYLHAASSFSQGFMHI